MYGCQGSNFKKITIIKIRICTHGCVQTLFAINPESKKLNI